MTNGSRGGIDEESATNQVLSGAKRSGLDLTGKIEMMHRSPDRIQFKIRLGNGEPLAPLTEAIRGTVPPADQVMFIDVAHSPVEGGDLAHQWTATAEITDVDTMETPVVETSGSTHATSPGSIEEATEQVLKPMVKGGRIDASQLRGPGSSETPPKAPDAAPRAPGEAAPKAPGAAPRAPEAAPKAGGPGAKAPEAGAKAPGVAPAAAAAAPAAPAPSAPAPSAPAAAPLAAGDDAAPKSGMSPWMVALAVLLAIGILGTALGALASEATAAAAATASLTGCKGGATSRTGDGSKLHSVKAPSGAASPETAFLVDYDGSVRYQGSSNSVIKNHNWKLAIYGIPVRTGGSENAKNEKRSQGVESVSGFIPFKTAGLFYVSGDITGQSGGSCVGDAWIKLAGSPVGTVPWGAGLALTLLGAIGLGMSLPKTKMNGVAPEADAPAPKGEGPAPGSEAGDAAPKSGGTP